jgi:hypothetical protein
MVAGGVEYDSSASLRSAELFDAATGKSTELAALPVARFNDLAVALEDGSVLVAGGLEDRSGPPAPEPEPTFNPDYEEPTDPPCVPQSAPVLRWVP